MCVQMHLKLPKPISISTSHFAVYSPFPLAFGVANVHKISSAVHSMVSYYLSMLNSMRLVNVDSLLRTFYFTHSDLVTHSHSTIVLFTSLDAFFSLLIWNEVFFFVSHSFIFRDSTLTASMYATHSVRDQKCGIRLYDSFFFSSLLLFQMSVSLEHVSHGLRIVVVCEQFFSFGFFFVIDSSTWYYVFLLFAYK